MHFGKYCQIAFQKVVCQCIPSSMTQATVSEYLSLCHSASLEMGPYLDFFFTSLIVIEGEVGGGD